MIGLFLISFLTLKSFIPAMQSAFPNMRTMATNVDLFEQTFNENIVAKSKWITLYGGSQRALLKHEINHFEVIKDQDGFLHMPVTELDADTLEAYSDNLDYFAKTCQENGIPFLFVMAPSDIIEGKTTMANGFSDASNYNNDRFLQLLAKKRIPYLDSRTLIADMPLEDIFYKTDHHWALPACFKTFSQIITTIAENSNLNLDPNRYYQNINNYTCKEYPNSFLGSRGIKVGEWYTGKDSFQVFVPQFETDFITSYYISEKKQWEKTGDFWQTMIQEDILNDCLYYNKYNAFLDGSGYENRIVNNLSSNHYRCLLIADSFGRQMVPYLSLCFGETVYLDPQIGRYNESYTSYIEEYKPDCVVVMFNGLSTYIPIPQ